MSIKKSIGWTDMTLNPIKGKCRGGCWYCWTKPLYERKFLQPKIRLRLPVMFNLPKKSQKIFLCSTHDLFGDWISKSWRDLIFANIKQYPQHTFQILTKFPQNIDREMPDNVWLGVSITNNLSDYTRLLPLKLSKAKLKFISFEPLLSSGEYSLSKTMAKDINWLIVGRLTGFGNKYNPTKEQIEKFIRFGKHFNIPIFLKDNLKEIWGEKLIQEMPE